MVFTVRDNDKLKWHPKATLQKWSAEQVAEVATITGIEEPSADILEQYFPPYETIEIDGNSLTLAGMNRLTSLIIGAGGQALTATAVRLGVGDDQTAMLPSDSDLSLSTGQYYQIMDATYPQQSNGAMTFKATFPTGVANFVWNNWGLDVGAPTVTSSATVNALLVNRKVHAMGQKVAGAWALTVIVTLT